jgi:hypothetical protein
MAKDVILPWPSSSFSVDDEDQVAAVKKRWPTEVATVVRAATSVAGERQALDALVQEYVETGERLNTQRLLGRVVKNYVAPDEHLIWCGKCEGSLAGTQLRQRGEAPAMLKPFWILITTRNLFVLPNKTATPLSYGIKDMAFIFTGGYRCSLGSRSSRDYHQAYVVNGTGLQVTEGGNPRYPGPGMRFLAALLWAQKNNGKPLTAPVKKARGSVREVPAPRLIRKARDAELVAADWLEYWGLGKATVSPVGSRASRKPPTTSLRRFPHRLLRDADCSS